MYDRTLPLSATAPCQLPLFIEADVLWWGADCLGDLGADGDRERLLYDKFVDSRRELDDEDRSLFVDLVHEGIHEPVQAGFVDGEVWLLDGHHRLAVSAVIGAMVPVIFAEAREPEYTRQYPWYRCDWGPWSRDEVSDGSWMHAD